jgi:hypothetical protein
MTMRLTLAIALALVASTVPAAAQQRMPREVVGKWCIVPPDTEALNRLPKDFPTLYERSTRCHHRDSDTYLTITSDGYRGHEITCKLLKVTTDSTTRVHRMRFRCEGEGETGIEEASMQRAMGVLLCGGRARDGARRDPHHHHHQAEKTHDHEI